MSEATVLWRFITVGPVKSMCCHLRTVLVSSATRQLLLTYLHAVFSYD